MSKAAVTRFVRPVILFAMLFAATWIAAREPAPPVHASPAAQPAAQSQIVGEGSNRAAVAVQFDNVRSEMRCVAFSEDSIRGDELLARSGLGPEMSPDGAVCSIGGEGCPSDDCSCGCPNTYDCQYWALYQWEGGGWVSSSLGAAANSFVVANGALHVWSWGSGDATSGAPDVTYDQICGSTTAGSEGTATTTATSTSTTTATATATTATQDGSGMTPLAASPTATLRPVVTQGPRPSTTVSQAQQGRVPTAAGSASPVPRGTLQGGALLAPTAEPPTVTPSPQPTPTPYRFSLPPTETPRPRRVLGAGSGPTATPLLLARAPGVSGQAPAANARNATSAETGGRKSLVQSAASAGPFSPALLPGYAAFIVTIAALLGMAWYALHRRNSHLPGAASESGDDEGPARPDAGKE